MIPYWIVFAYCVMQCIGLNSQYRSDREARLPMVTLWLPIVIVLGLFAGFRSPESSADYLNYKYWIDSVAQSGGLDLKSFVSKAPVFQFLGEHLVGHNGGLVPLMLVTALLSLLIEVWILESDDYKGLIGFGLMFLIGRFFLVHEFTQVRAALAISLATLGLIFCLQGNWLRGALIFVVGAFTHISVLGLVPLFAVVVNLSPGRKWVKIIIACIGALSLAVFVVELDVVSMIAAGVSPYLTGQYDVTETRLLSVYFVAKVVILLLMGMQWRSLNKSLRLAFIASVYGIMLSVVFFRNDVLSLRLSELVSIFDCICFAYVFRSWWSREQVLATLMAVMVASEFYFSATKIVHGYSIVL